MDHLVVKDKLTMQHWDKMHNKMHLKTMGTNIIVDWIYMELDNLFYGLTLKLLYESAENVNIQISSCV